MKHAVILSFISRIRNVKDHISLQKTYYWNCQSFIFHFHIFDNLDCRKISIVEQLRTNIIIHK